jgi:hypothetical protein
MKKTILIAVAVFGLAAFGCGPGESKGEGQSVQQGDYATAPGQPGGAGSTAGAAGN